MNESRVTLPSIFVTAFAAVIAFSNLGTTTPVVATRAVTAVVATARPHVIANGVAVVLLPKGA